MSNPKLSHAAIELKAQLHTTDQLPTMHADAVLPQLPEGDLWVFGYGSLLWRPGFEYIEKVDGRIYGYHRALCVSSWVHRGTPDHPGLVLGLDRGGSCTGKLFRVSAAIKQQVASYLYDRELPTMVYNARIIKIHRRDDSPIEALTFIVDPHHPQYSQIKAPQELAGIVSTAIGIYGNSQDYLISTLEHLREDGIFDAHLEAVAAHL